MTANKFDGETAAEDMSRSSRVGAPLLWALSVGASIGGIFNGWNAGLAQAGYGGMLVATLVVIVLYAFLAMSIAELSAMMPFAGGTTTYARVAFGLWGGFLAAVAALIAYVFAMTSLMELMTTEVTRIIDELKGPHIPAPALWAFLLVFFGWLNLKDRRTFFNAALFLALAALAVLFVTAVAALPSFDQTALLSIPPRNGGSPWLPHGLIGIAFAAPFAIWFFLSIEVVAFAAEDARAPGRDIPASLLTALLTVVVCALAIFTILSGAKPGALAISAASDPIDTSLEAVVGKTHVLYLIPLLGAVVGFHSVIYAASRVVFSLSRSGYLPSALASMDPERGTPVKAVAAVCIAVFVISCITLVTQANVEIMINMAAIGGLVSYLFVFASYVKLHARHPNLNRPFVSTFGGTGAIAGLLMTFGGLLLLLIYNKQLSALIGCIAIFLLASILFVFLRPRKMPPDAPEEIYIASIHDNSTS